jgi:hypothetical protein
MNDTHLGHGEDELHKLNRIEHLCEKILHLLEHKGENVAKSARLIFTNSQGETTMPASAHVNDKPGSYKYQEFDGPNGTGNKVPPTGAVVYKSDAPTVATIDPASGQLTYVGPGVANISADDGGNLPASDALTLSAAIAVSSTLAFVPPA